MNNLNELQTIEKEGQRVLTTAQLAESYETDMNRITYNFNANKSRYCEGKHYYCLKGTELAAFKNNIGNSNVVKNNAKVLYLWTEKGALLHAKSLNTDKAWEVYDWLVESYFRARKIFHIPQTYPEALQLAADLAKQIEEQKPLVAFVNKVGNTNSLIGMGEMAKILYDKNIPLGRNKLMTWLRENKILQSNNMPYQQYVNRGYFVVRDVVKGDRVFPTTYITGKGQQYIVSKLQNELNITISC